MLVQYFSDIWRIFQVESPILGLTFAELWFGLFVVGISIKIFISIFGVANESNITSTGFARHNAHQRAEMWRKRYIKKAKSKK